MRLKTVRSLAVARWYGGDTDQGESSVMLRRLANAKGTLEDGFVNKIGGNGQYDAIDADPPKGETTNKYNKILNTSWNEILSGKHPLNNSFIGAMKSLSGEDYSKGAYFWNASSPQKGFNWNMYNKGTFIITHAVNGTTFFKYNDNDTKRIWP